MKDLVLYMQAYAGWQADRLRADIREGMHASMLLSGNPRARMPPLALQRPACIATHRSSSQPTLSGINANLRDELEIGTESY
jgi:hypothetical protein